MMKMTGGELLVEALRGLGVRFVFSIIGGQMCSVYDALGRCPDMELVTIRNEVSAPIMAAGAAAVTGVPAVSMCTVGAGVVYEVSGLLAAWYQYLPVISIAPQVQSWKMKPHQENLQGLNQDGIFEPITKWNAIVYHWDRIPSLVARAMREALANAPGPVHLDAPVDVLFQTKKVDPAKLRALLPPAAHTRYCGSLPGPADQVGPAAAALARAERPIVIVGQGFGRPGRWPELRAQLNTLGAPVLLSDASSGALDGRDECHAGAAGLLLNSPAGLDALREADGMLVLGLDDQVLELLAALGPDAPPLIQVEIDPSAVVTGRPGHLGVNADPVSFLQAVPPADWSIWRDRLKQAAGAVAKQTMEAMPELSSALMGVRAGLQGGEVIVVDGERTVRAAYAALLDARHGGLFLMDSRLAGAGLPFALGAKIAAPERRVIVIADRDSLLRHVRELQTASARKLALELVCVDPGNGTALTRTEAILGGLGAETARIARGQAPSPAPSDRPRAWLYVN